jgi:hypothetical protein
MAPKRNYSPDPQATPETGTDVATVTPANGNATPDTTSEVSGITLAVTAARRYQNYMLARAREVGTNRAEEVSAGQMARILATADKDDVTEEDIFNADQGGTIQARDVPGLEVEIHDMVPILSNREDIVNNKGYYISCNATVLGGPEDILERWALDLGADIVLQTGAPLIETKIRAFEARGFLPVKGVITAIKTGSGNDVLKLRPLPKRVTS